MLPGVKEIVIITRMILLCCHYGSQPLRNLTQFSWWMQTQCQVAANSQNKPTDLGCKSADNWQLPASLLTINSYHLHPPLPLTIITQPKNW